MYYMYFFRSVQETALLFYNIIITCNPEIKSDYFLRTGSIS